MGVDRLRTFINGIGNIITGLRTNEAFKEKFKSLIELAKTPLVQSIVSFDMTIIDSVHNALVNSTVSTSLM